MTEDTPTRLREPMRRLLLSARILLQNAKGCAQNHYGNDTELNGLPGWLADCENDIAAGEIELSAQSAEVERLRGVVGPLLDELECTLDQYHRNGPDWTFKDGTEVFAASVLLDRAELIQSVRAALAKDATP